MKIKRSFKKLLKSFFVLFLVFSWLLTGWPAIQIHPDFRFPPKVKEAHAAVAYDASSESHTGTTGSASQASFTWTNTPAGTPRGVLVFVFTTANADYITSVTYGGTAMTRVTGGQAIDTATEAGRTDTFFLGASVPTGAQSVVVNRTNNTTVMYAVAYTVTAAADTSTAGIVLLNDNQVLTVQAVNDGSPGTNSVRFAGVNSGATASPPAGTGSTLGPGIAFTSPANRSVSTVRETTAGQGSRNVGFSYGTSDDVAAVHLAVVEIVPVTTISNFVSGEPSNSTIAPAASGQVDSFGLQTNTGTDTVTGATVTLAAGTGVRISTVAITNDGDTITYCSVAPSGDTATLTSCGIPVSTTNTQFKVKITAVSHSSMPAPPGAEYSVTATVTSFTSTNAQSGTDSGSATVTIDNLSPNGATSVSGTAGDTKVTLNWTSSSSTDFDTTNGSVILRWASGTAGSEVPAEGNSSYVAGNTITTATVACVISSAVSTALNKIDGTGGSAGCTTAALTNGQAYTYKAFQRDTNGNYDAGVSIGTFTPSAAVATFTQNKYLWYVDNDLADPTAIWGTPDLIENQSIVVVPPGNDPPDSAQELRLRVNYVVNTTSISISEKYFKLEYKAGTDGTCTTGSWTDVGTGAWVYATSTVTDGADVAKVLSDTTTGKGEEYVKGKPSQVNHVAASAAEIIEYDFHIVGTSSIANTQYSFRVVETNSGGTSETVFDGYTNCPTLATEPGTANLLRHGNVFTEALEKGFFWTN